MNPKLKPGNKAPDFRLPSTDGRVIHLSDEWLKSQATVVMFLCNHCPYVKAYLPRLIELQKQFDSYDPPVARLIGICSNDADTYPEDSFASMKAAPQEWGFNFPYLHDEDQAVARAYGAQRTPEIFVLDSGGICRYEGGIDDCYQDASKVTQQPLRDAVLAVAAGKAVAQPHSFSIGCTIKWKKG